MARRIDPATLAPVVGTFYPPPFHTPCLARARTKLGDAAGLTQFGVNLLRLPPGAWSSQRHWQTLSDEFVFVLAGDVTLVTDAGEEVLKAGEAAGFNRLRKDGRLRMGERIFVQERMTRRYDVVASWQAADESCAERRRPADPSRFSAAC